MRFAGHLSFLLLHELLLRAEDFEGHVLVRSHLEVRILPLQDTLPHRHRLVILLSLDNLELGIIRPSNSRGGSGHGLSHHGECDAPSSHLGFVYVILFAEQLHDIQMGVCAFRQCAISMLIFHDVAIAHVCVLDAA